MQGFFYATPILYPLTLVPAKATYILMVSPVAQVIQDIRLVAVTPKTETIATVFGTSLARVIPLVIVLITLVVAIVYFKRRSKGFAEEI